MEKKELQKIVYTAATCGMMMAIIGQDGLQELSEKGEKNLLETAIAAIAITEILNREIIIPYNNRKILDKLIDELEKEL